MLLIFECDVKSFQTSMKDSQMHSLCNVLIDVDKKQVKIEVLELNSICRKE